MALPKLSNDRPIYEMNIPSTNEVVKYRPFLVKEQKTMLVAFESQDPKQILNPFYYRFSYKLYFF